MRSAIGDVGFVGEEDRAHRHRLQRLFGNVPQHRRGVEPDLGALRRCEAAAARCAVVAHARRAAAYADRCS